MAEAEDLSTTTKKMVSKKLSTEIAAEEEVATIVKTTKRAETESKFRQATELTPNDQTPTEIAKKARLLIAVGEPIEALEVQVSVALAVDKEKEFIGRTQGQSTTDTKTRNWQATKKKLFLLQRRWTLSTTGKNM